MAKKIPIVLGTFRVPVKVVGAIKEEKDTELHQVCTGSQQPQTDENGEVVTDDDGNPVLVTHDPVRIRQEQRCPHCGFVKKANTWQRAKDDGAGNYAVLTEEQYAEAKGVSKDVTHTLTLTLHPREQVEERTLSAGRFYWVEPDGFEKEYALLVHGLSKHPDKAACAIWAPSTAPAMWWLRSVNGVLGLQQLAWPTEVQAPPVVTAEPELKWEPVLEQLLDLLTDDFDPATFYDDRKRKLKETLESVQAVHAGLSPELAEKDDEAGNPLLAALAQVRAAKGLDPTEAPPVQPLPEVLPENVKVVAPKKKAAKKAPARAKKAS